MRVFVLGSGSSGNATLVESASGARLLLDAGINPTRAVTRMRELGADLFTWPAHDRAARDIPGTGETAIGGVQGIVVTHHHGDHVAQLLPLARALRAPVYLHAGIDAPQARGRLPVRAYAAGAAVRIGPFLLEALPVPHDAPQVALRVTARDEPYAPSFGLATDLGHVPRGLADFLGACDLALVEANYCPLMLADGPYPPRLKARVRGGLGHLANEETAELARALVGRRIARLLLGHVSRTNNSSARAHAVVAARCTGLPTEVVPHGVPRAFDVVPSPRPSRGMAANQLHLPFG